MSEGAAKSICVIGAGVVGLTTALELSRRGHRTTIVTSAELQGTTSSVAAAFWYPFWTGQEPDHTWYSPDWAAHTYYELESLAHSAETGVTETTLVEYFDEKVRDDQLDRILGGMWWRAIPSVNLSELSPAEVGGVAFEGATRIRFRRGLSFRTFVVNMPVYLTYLQERFEKEGGQIERKRVGLLVLNGQSDQVSLGELVDAYDFVVNCSGLGSAALCPNDLIPIEGTARGEKIWIPALVRREGVVVRVEPVVGVDNIILVHTGIFDNKPVYIVPRGKPITDIVLGGTIFETDQGEPQHFDSLDKIPSDTDGERIRSDAELILERCEALESRLGGASIKGVSVGYRPARMPRVRLEPEGLPPYCGKLIHNYGHAGGGVTLSWGCARRVGEWIQLMSARRHTTSA